MLYVYSAMSKLIVFHILDSKRVKSNRDNKALLSLNVSLFKILYHEQWLCCVIYKYYSSVRDGSTYVGISLNLTEFRLKTECKIGFTDVITTNNKNRNSVV